ncbi:hypothetical protein SCA6_007109 [Theobroma cacao]
MDLYGYGPLTKHRERIPFHFSYRCSTGVKAPPPPPLTFQKSPPTAPSVLKQTLQFQSLRNPISPFSFSSVSIKNLFQTKLGDLVALNSNIIFFRSSSHLLSQNPQILLAINSKEISSK